MVSPILPGDLKRKYAQRPMLLPDYKDDTIMCKYSVHCGSSNVCCCLEMLMCEFGDKRGMLLKRQEVNGTSSLYLAKLDP